MRIPLIFAILAAGGLMSTAPAQDLPSDFTTIPLLPAKVWRLDSGAVVSHNLIAVTPTAYENLHQELATGERLLVVRSGDLARANNQHRLDVLALAAREEDIRYLRGVIAKRDAQLTQLEALSDHFWTKRGLLHRLAHRL